MPPPKLLGIRRSSPRVGGELANRFQHPVAPVREANEALVHQRLEHVDIRFCTSSAASSVQPPGRRTAGRTASAPPLQQVVRPLDRRSQRPLALGEIACSAGQKRQALLEPLEDLRRGESLARAAASSSASGRSSRRRQISETPRRARSRSSRLSPWQERSRPPPRGRTAVPRTPAHPVTCSRSLLVTRRSRFGQEARSATTSAAASTTCSKLSKRQQHLSSWMCSGEAVLRADDRAAVASTSSGSRGARAGSTRRHPNSYPRQDRRPVRRVASCPSPLAR